MVNEDMKNMEPHKPVINTQSNFKIVLLTKLWIGLRARERDRDPKKSGNGRGTERQ